MADGPPPPRPLPPRPPGLLSYDAWRSKTWPFLDAIRAYWETILSTASPNHPQTGACLIVDRESFFDAMFAFIYRTSANRFRRYQIIA